MAKRQERKERITQERREQILNAALTVFSNKGYGEATMPDIAQEASVAVGTIYNYYQSKRDLLISLIDTFVVTKPFRQLIERLPEADDATFLSSIIEARLDFGFENLDRFFFLLSEVQRDSELRQQYAKQVLMPILQLLERYLKTRIDSGAFRNLNARVAACALPGMIIGLVLLHRIEGESSPFHEIPRQQLVTELTNLILNGIQRKGD